MIIGLGIDLEETARIRESITKFGDHFLHKVFTTQEIAFCRGKVNEAERFAARFAAKEAAFKALQGEWSKGLRWVDFEVLISPCGAPKLLLHGKAAELASEKGVDRLHVSFTHTKEMVSAVVVMESA